jgi:hypothetical protein
MRWANGVVIEDNKPRFTDAAIADFAKFGDAWIVAFAKANGYTVITQEVLNKYTQIKSLMCVMLFFPYMNTFDMLRNLNVRFT